VRGLAGISVLAQVIGLLSIVFLVVDIVTLPDSLIEQAAGETALVNQYLVETIESYRWWLPAGAVGGIVAWLLILKGRYRADWFLKTSRVLAWIWMPLIPAGTAIGVLVLSARAAAIADKESQQ